MASCLKTIGQTSLVVHVIMVLFLIINILQRSTAYREKDHGKKSDEGDEEEWGMVRRKGNQFVVDWRPLYVNGFNTYWLMILAADESTRGKVTEVFQQAASAGLDVCRTWAFNDGGWRALQISPSLYDEHVFEALDFVVNEASKYKIRLILSLVNNWDAYGGKAQYVKWGKAAGLNFRSDDDFFSDPTLKSYYKAHVKMVLTRVNTFNNVSYMDDPTIFAWELMNEPRCLADPSGDVLQAWIEEMAVHVKSIDKAHLLGIGVEGFYGPSTPERLPTNPNTFAGQVGTDFIRNHRTLGVDYASVHIYPDAWLSSKVSSLYMKFTREWMETHIADADGQLLGMPVLFEEYGVSSDDGGFNVTFREEFVSSVLEIQLASTRRGAAGAGTLIWQVFPRGTDYMDDGYAVVLPKSPATASILARQSRRLESFNSRCSWRCQWGCKKMEGAGSVVDDVDDDDIDFI